MYSTGNINLRASWSTSSEATQIEKGTELTITGTSSEKINGYVWYRVSYNGQTKYVSSSLLTSTKPEEEKKSDNANLASISIKDFEIEPKFSADVTSYTLKVSSEIEKLEIEAKAEDEKASVSIQGNEDLKIGDNLVIISVSAEDGTTKLYEIKVIKEEEKAFGLKSLKIEDTKIDKEFKTDKYEYTIEVKDLDKLDIEAIATEEDALIEIVGNQDLVEGENLITIIVKSKDEQKTATYQLNVNKRISNKAETKTTDNLKNNKIFIYGGIALVTLIILTGVVIYIIKNRNKDNMYYEVEDDENYKYNDEEDDEIDFPGELPEKIEEDKDTKDKNKFGKKGKHF